MRRFELSDGSSDKFWEVSRSGSDVTVHYGRIGTNGQTKLKDLGSEDKAKANVEKLIREKTAKGYVEIGGSEEPAADAAEPDGTSDESVTPTTSESAPDETPAPEPQPAVEPAAAARSTASAELPDEETFVVPGPWKRSVLPIRGVDKVTAPKPVADAVETARALRQHLAEAVEASFLHDEAAPELVAVARAVDLEAAEPGPALGVAVHLRAMTEVVRWDRRDEIETFVPDLLERHGAAFLAEVMANVGRILYSRGWSRGGDPPRLAGPGDLVLWRTLDLLRPARRIFAAADDATHAEVVARLEGIRDQDVNLRIVAALLVPDRTNWVEETVAELEDLAAASGINGNSNLHVCGELRTATVDPAILERVHVLNPRGLEELVVQTSVAAHLGAASVPYLVPLLDRDWDAESRKGVLSRLAPVPGDEVFDELLNRLDQKYVGSTVMTMIDARPYRAMRRLAARVASRGPNAGEAKRLLEGHGRTNPDVVAAVAPLLTDTERAALDVAIDTSHLVPVAEPAALPEVLTRVPWEHRVKAAAAVVVDGLAAPDGVEVVWRDGERDEWRNAATNWHAPRSGWDETMQRIDRGAGNDYLNLGMLAIAPDELARPRLGFRPNDLWNSDGPVQRLLARFEVEAAGLAVHAASNAPGTLGATVAPVRSAEVATMVADWHVRLVSAREHARRWLARNADVAPAFLVPAAVGPIGKERTAAGEALRYLDSLGHRDDVLAAAAAHGDEAVTAVTQLLDEDPLQRLPKSIPSLPSWFSVAQLPQILLADRSAALPDDAVTGVAVMLAMSKPGEPYAGLALVQEATDPASLAAWGRALFAQWAGVEFPNKEKWVLAGQEFIGDDDTVRELSPLIRIWPKQAGHARAVAGLDVLAGIGTEVALMHLHRISEKTPTKGLRTKAQEKIDEIAERLGLSTDQLADRLVPDLGLDADGTMLLDYGPRSFSVAFDEALKPVITEGGKVRKSLPKPGAKDDPELAPDAHARFAALRKDVKGLASDQIRRLERAMVQSRRWSAEDHRALFVEHPLVWHLVRRLVWGTFDDDGNLTASFRFAEDRTAANVDDDTFTVPDDATVGIVHPLHLGDTVAAWAEVFADYEILQPFAQLGRDVHRLDPAERDAGRLTRFEDVKMETGRVLGLANRGWERGNPQDGGVWSVTNRPCGPGVWVTISLNPGVVIGEPTWEPEQTIDAVGVGTRAVDGWFEESTLTFAALDEVAASEVLRDLEMLRG